MKNVKHPLSVFCGLAASFAVSACSSTSTSGGVVPASTAPTARQTANATRSAHRSWMDPAAAKGRLLYVADEFANAVFVYTYPQLSGAGELSSFGSVTGICTDRRGYVWVLDQANVEVAEFAHGGTTPINVLHPGEASGNPGVGNGCTVNPKTGDLAVAGAGPGITVFKNGQSTHDTFWDFTLFQFNYIGYDAKGNLFADGLVESSFNFALDELPAGSSTLNSIRLAGGSISRPGGIQWDGKYLDIADSTNGTIYRTDGSSILSSITTSAACQGQFYIVPNFTRVIDPDPCSVATGIYAYPAGGSPLKTVTGGQQFPIGAAVSVAN